MHAPFWLALIAFAGATVNGLLGHGFSTLSVPLSLLFLANRLLNPILVLLEVVLNLGAFLGAREHFGTVAAHVKPIARWLLPGVVAGSALLWSVGAGPMKVITYAALLPLVLLQAAGLRWRASAPAAAPVLGSAIGALYAATTISGPILSLHFQNQGIDRAGYRAGISFLRLVESVLTALVYLALGLFTPASLRLSLGLLVPVLAGLALGHALAARIPEGAFHRACLAFNTFAVGFGLARQLHAFWPSPLLNLLWLLPTPLVILLHGTYGIRIWAGFRGRDLDPAPVDPA